MSWVLYLALEQLKGQKLIISSEAVHQSRPTSKPYIQMIDFFLNNVKQKKMKSNCRIQHLKSENMIHVRSIVSSL